MTKPIDRPDWECGNALLHRGYLRDIASGSIWQDGPEARHYAIDMIVSGQAPRPANMPANIAAYVDGLLARRPRRRQRLLSK